MPHPKYLSAITSLAIMILSLTSSMSFGQGSIEIEVSDVQLNSGPVVVEIYNSEAGWLEDPFQRLSLASDKAVQTATFDVPYGKYAITVYQDLNSNGEADMNFLGIPKELVGFGNNYHPFGEPKYGSCLVDFTSDTPSHKIKLYSVF